MQAPQTKETASRGSRPAPGGISFQEALAQFLSYLESRERPAACATRECAGYVIVWSFSMAP